MVSTALWEGSAHAYLSNSCLLSQPSRMEAATDMAARGGPSREAARVRLRACDADASIWSGVMSVAGLSHGAVSGLWLYDLVLLFRQSYTLP